MQKNDIPANLQAALEKIEANGTIPLLIPVALESFLSEQGLYRSSMTPQEAWQTLQELTEPSTTEPLPAKEPVTDTLLPQTQAEVAETQEPSAEAKDSGFLWRRKKKK